MVSTKRAAASGSAGAPQYGSAQHGTYGEGSEHGSAYEAWLEEKEELALQLAAGELDIGQCDSVDDYGDEDLAGGAAGTCLYKLALTVGVETKREVTRVVDIPEYLREELRRQVGRFKIYYVFYSKDDQRNHVQCVEKGVRAARIDVVTVDTGGQPEDKVAHAVTSFDNFFAVNANNPVSEVHFYSGENLSGFDDRFGADVETGLPDVRGSRGSKFGTSAVRAESVVDEQSSHGGANVNRGVIRPRRRVVAAKSTFTPGAGVTKGYVSSKGLMFNNLNEIFQDTISREYAQEILESVFDAWGVPKGEPDAFKYAEDLVLAFVIATTASNKADYDKEFEVPTSAGGITARFRVFSDVLISSYGITRRQFARAMADEMRAFLKLPENVHLLPQLATRAGCDPQMATLVFDGSTHCTSLTSSEVTFTKLLESRNLFEDDAVIADGASARLMQGMSSGVRSKVQR